MDRITLWHVHDIAGNCCGVAVTYDTAFKVCIKLYLESEKQEYFFATALANATMNTRPLPNS